MSAGKRDIDGVLILDKPSGITSNKALQTVKRLLRAHKAGHCGSLDPLATGVLPICLGQATRFSGYLLSADKTYRARCRLGQVTTTGDADGELIRESEVDLDQSQIAQALNPFRGEIEQIPPMFSALKQKGRRLYELARAGIEVERAPRSVIIHRLELLGYASPVFEIEVACSKGTYVRTLVEDIGATLGCGAHLIELRRIKASPFEIEAAVTLEVLQADVERDGGLAHVLPVWSALKHFPLLELDTCNSEQIIHGKVLTLDSPPTAGLYRLMSASANFLGLGEVTSEGMLKAKRLMNTTR